MVAVHARTKAELIERVAAWAALDNAQRLYLGAHGHGREGQEFDGFGPSGDFMSWMELADFLAALPHQPDSLHLGACGSMAVAEAWSENRVAERLPEMSLITYAANTITPFIRCALERSLDDSGWDPLVFLDQELPRLREAAGIAVHMHHPNRNRNTKRTEFIAVEAFPEVVGVDFRAALIAQGSRPLRPFRYSRNE
ncbi:MAG: hypothetical protein OZ928_08135 [Polyangiaceae bacterium]|nr:hypothetical protein [Polyangiaceae bacterium]